MLKHLLIKNYALIEHLEINPDEKLTMITGETGAGKSIMLGALGLLMGNRADIKSLFDENHKCIIEGTFNIAKLKLNDVFEQEELDFEDICLIRREISPSGKSRAFINDTPVTLDVLKSIGAFLMDIHSQHDTLLLGSNPYQLQIVDDYAQNSKLKTEYSKAFGVYNEIKTKHKALLADSVSLKKEFDYNNFLLEELLVAKLKPEEKLELEEELIILENAEEVKQRLKISFEFLSNPEMSILSMLKDATANLNGISVLSSAYKEIRDRLQSTLIELGDVANEIEITQEKVELDDNRIVIVKDRLDLIFRLLQKHGQSEVSDLLIIQNDLQEKVSNVLNLSDTFKELENELNNSYAEVQKLAAQLSKTRIEKLNEIENQLVSLLKDLGIPNAHFQIESKEKSPDKDGIDEINFLFSANKGMVPRGLKDVASGGEFSRVMLAIKYILAGKRTLPTIIFDEIDTGISGEVANKVGKMMKEMSTNLQVLSITHLHQIAGVGNSHFFVYKENSESRTISKMKKIEGEERILEIAKMIGGQNPSLSAIQSAKEVLL